MILLMPLLCFLAAFVLMAAVNWLELVPWRKSANEHWTERSRILWPVRKTGAILLIYVPLLVAVCSTLVSETTLLGLVPRWLAAYAGAMGSGWFMIRQMFPGIRLRPWLHEISIGWALRIAIWLVLLVIGVFMPDEFSLRAWLMLAGAAVLTVAWTYLALALLRLTGILRPPDERLRKIVAGCTTDDGPRVKALWQAGGVMANAYALPLTGTLLFLDGLMETLNDEEVATICAHEMGHLAESGWVIAGRHLGALSMLPLLLIKPAATQWGFPGAMAMVLLMFLWARIAQRLSHHMETRADAVAGNHPAGDGVYARALEKIYQHNHLPAVTSEKRSTHPHLYDRMLAAGVTPEFPRPRVPRKFTLLGWLMLVAGPSSLILILGDGFLFSGNKHRRTDRDFPEHHSPAIQPVD